MKPFSKKETHGIINMFSKQCKKELISVEEFKTCLKNVVTEEYISFLLSQMEAGQISWKNVIYEITSHFYKLPDLGEVLNQISQYEKVSGKTGDALVSEKQMSLVRFWWEKYPGRNPKMKKSADFANVMFRLFQKEDSMDSRSNYSQFVLQTCLDVDVKRTMTKMVGALIELRKEKGITKQIAERIIFFNSGPNEKLRGIISELFKTRKILPLNEFLDHSEFNKRKNLKKLMIDDESPLCKFECVSINKRLCRQIYAPALFEDNPKFSAYVSTYCLYLFSKALERGNCKLDPMFLIMGDETRRHHEEYIIDSVCRLVREKPRSNLGRLVVGNVKRRYPSVVDGLYQTRELIMRAIPRKIALLKSELEDKERPLSTQGQAKIGGFVTAFQKLLSEFENDKTLKTINDPRLKKELMNSRSLVSEYIVSECGKERLWKFVLADPQLDAVEALDLLIDPSSGFYLGENGVRNCIAFSGFNFQRTKCLLRYDFSLFPGEVAQGDICEGSHFVAIETFKKVLCRAAVEVLFGFRPFVLLSFLTTFPKFEKLNWVGVVVKKNSDNELELVAVNKENGKLPLMSVVFARNEDLFTTFVWNNSIVKVSECFTKVKEAFGEGNAILEFIRDLELKLRKDTVLQSKVEKDLIPDFIDVLLGKFECGEKLREKKKMAHELWELLEKYFRDGTTMNYQELLEENRELKKKVEELSVRLDGKQ